MKKLILIITILFSSNLNAEPVLRLIENKISEYSSREDIVMVVFKAKGDTQQTMENIKAAMRTRDPMGIYNPYWVVNLLEEEISRENNCGVVFAQWYAQKFPYSRTWETVMQQAFKQHVLSGGYYYSLGTRSPDVEKAFISKVSEICLKDHAALSITKEEAEWIRREMAKQFDGTEGEFLVDSVRDVTVKLRNIDDSGFVMVRNPQGIYINAQMVEWNVINKEASGIVSLKEYFEIGTNLVIFALHNKTPGIGKGKWSYNIELFGDNKLLWKNADQRMEGGSGIKYWIPFSVEKSLNGMLIIKKASEDQILDIAPEILDFNKWLVKNRGNEKSMDAVVLPTLIFGAIAIMSMSSASENEVKRPMVAPPNFLDRVRSRTTTY